MSTSDDEEFYDPPSSPLSDEDPVSMELAPESSPDPELTAVLGQDDDNVISDTGIGQQKVGAGSWNNNGKIGDIPSMAGSSELDITHASPISEPVEVCRKGSLEDVHVQPVDLDVSEHSSIDANGTGFVGTMSDGLNDMESFALSEPEALLDEHETATESEELSLDCSAKHDTDHLSVACEATGSSPSQSNNTDSSKATSKDSLLVSAAESSQQKNDEPVPLCDTEPLPLKNGEPLPLGDTELLPPQNGEPIPYSEPLSQENGELHPSDTEPLPQNNNEPLPLRDNESLSKTNGEPLSLCDTDHPPQKNSELLPPTDTEPLPQKDSKLHPHSDNDSPLKPDHELHPICDTEPLPTENGESRSTNILRTHSGHPVTPNDNRPPLLSDTDPDDLDDLVLMQHAHDITNTSNIDILDRNLSIYVAANMDDSEQGPDNLASPDVLPEVFASPLICTVDDGKALPMLATCHKTPTINSTDVTAEGRHTSTSSLTLDNVTSSTLPTEPQDPVTSMDTTKETAMIFSDTAKCSDVQKSTTPDELVVLSNEDSTSAKSSTCAGPETDSNAEKNAGEVSSVCHNRILNSQQPNADDKEIDIRSHSPDRRSVVDKDTKFDAKAQRQTQETPKGSAEKTDHNANVQPMDKKDVPSFEGVPQEFLSKMEALGSKSKSLGSLAEKSSVTIGPLSPSSSANKLTRQDTFPFKNAPTAKEDRTIKIVRVSSVDTISPGVTMDKSKDVKREDKGYTESTKATLTAMRKSLTQNEPKTSEAKATKNDTGQSGMKDSIDSKTVLKLLDNLERHLEHERKLRERADDWADFLTSELEAHIDARTKSEEKYTVMRGKFLQYKEKSSAKYQRLVAEHKALLLQIRDITRDDSAPKKDLEDVRTPSPLLRRNRSQADRSALMTKRNALLIRGSHRKQSSEEDDESENGENHTAENNVSHEENGKLPNSIADVRTGWQRSLEEKKQAAAKLEKNQNKTEKSPTKTEPVLAKTEVSPLRTEKSPPKSGSLPKIDIRPKSIDLGPATKGLTDLSPPSKGFTRHGSLQTRQKVYVRRSSSTSQSDTDGKDGKPSTNKTPPNDNKTRSTPERLSIVNSHNTRQSPKTSTPTASLKPRTSIAPDTDDEPGSGNSVIDVKAFTNMWEKKLAKLPFEAQTSKGTPTIPGRGTGEDSPTFASVPTSPVSSGIPSRRSSRQNGDDTFELDDDDDLYLSAQEDEFDDSTFPKSEGVLNDSINTKQVRNMFQNIANSSMSTPKSEAPRTKLSYSASAREQRSKVVGKGVTETQSAHPPQRTRPRAKTLTDGIPKMDGIDGGSENGGPGSERSAKFSSLMSKWQKQ